ncbi:hypothetical protein N0V90_000140 [Kalmusia sp. IMI 367209]|nr:hypothetical protein N0V90_000140 [Kalmusia sp. IMI 367209]
MVSIKTLSLLAIAGLAAAAPHSANENEARAAPAYMAVVNEYRTKLGVPKLTRDTKLEANAYKTCKDGNGQMVHQLIPPTMAQVLAPGNMSKFKNIYVGGWLCERPNLPGLGNECAKEGQGWAHPPGQTGHADILRSTTYTRIGCASEGGIVGCDLR